MSILQSDTGERAEFTSDMKVSRTILAPDIFPLHLELIRQVFLNHGFKFEIMHYQGSEVIELALENIHNDMCYPLICIAGQALYALKSGDWKRDDVAFIQFQTGGGCRASNYIWLLRKALKASGYADVPVISLSFNKMEKNSGFSLDIPFLLEGIASVVYGDMLMLLRNQTKPYEKNSGESDALVDKWIAELSEQFRTHKRVFGRRMRKNLSAIIKSFEQIEIENTRKVKVAIIGEIYVKYSPFGNNNLEQFLLSEGCEVMVPGVFAFVEYCFYNRINDHISYSIGSRLSNIITKMLLGYCKKVDKMFRGLLSPTRFTPPCSFDGLIENAQKVFDTHIEMGEGWLLPSEAAEAAESGYENIVCAQPFGCLPNHIVAKGFSKKFKELYPDVNFMPIDYDSSQSRVNQENRLRLMLSLAREKLK